MSLFIETIKIEQGIIHNLEYHQTRFDDTRKAFWNNKHLSPINLQNIILPPDNSQLYRCRIIYSKTIQSIEYLPYTIRPISKLKIIHHNNIYYPYKSADRSVITELLGCRQNADDILIVRNQQLTDTSIANIALYKRGEWHTPKYPLLKGTQREYLLHRKEIIEEIILIDSLFSYSHIALFNAMIDFKALIFPINTRSVICNL